MTRELLQQALDVLEALQGGCTDSNDGTVEAITVWCPEVIDALKQALAAPIDGFGGNLDEAFAPAGMLMVPKEPTPEMRRAGVALHQKHTGHLSEVITAVYRSMIAAAPAPAVPAVCDGGTCGLGGYCANCPRLSAAPAVREPLIDEMDAVASKYAHKLALDLECVLSDYNGRWWDTAMQTIGEYRMAMNRIHERESPTHMGEPVLPKHGIGGGGK